MDKEVDIPIIDLIIFNSSKIIMEPFGPFIHP
jgi:hypothetical protein